MSVEGSDFLSRVDVDGALGESGSRALGVSRAEFLIAAGAAAGLLVAAGPRDALARGAEPPARDVEVLNFALSLEYLQASFYTEAERLGALTGAAKEAAPVVGSVERAHVVAFRDLLGRDAMSRPAFDFQGTTEDSQAFLKTAVAFEDLAVAAYGGQAPRLRSRPALAAALSINSVEARHAAWMRYLFGVVPAQRPFDAPRSADEVEQVVRSTHFVVERPATEGRRAPRYTG